MVRLLHAALDRGRDVAGQQRRGKPKQRGPWVAEAAQLAAQHGFQPPEQAFDPPPRAVGFGDPPCVDRLGQVAPQPGRGLAVLGGLIQRKLGAPPGRGLGSDEVLIPLANSLAPCWPYLLWG